jgi:hypothetical protein
MTFAQYFTSIEHFSFIIISLVNLRTGRTYPYTVEGSCLLGLRWEKRHSAQTKPRGLQMNGNIFAAPAQYRVEKARDPLQPQPFRRLQEIRPKPQAKG